MLNLCCAGELPGIGEMRAFFREIYEMLQQILIDWLLAEPGDPFYSHGCTWIRA